MIKEIILCLLILGLPLFLIIRTYFKLRELHELNQKLIKKYEELMRK